MVESKQKTVIIDREEHLNYERQAPPSKGVQQRESVPKIEGDYQARKLDYCHFCGEKYNVGARIPRILVHCGHTFCTECLQNCLFRNSRVRCPICKKLVKNLETPERLPLNINILYEVVECDPLLSQIDFDDESPEAIQDKLCGPHNDRIMHFYCSNHRTIFCRECIQIEHTDEKCFVVDLYEIEKMRKLQSQNIALNKGQLGKRRDGASQSCVIEKPFVKKEQPLPIIKQTAKVDQGVKDYMVPGLDYCNEETDEAHGIEADGDYEDSEHFQYLLKKKFRQEEQHQKLIEQLKLAASQDGHIFFDEDD